MAAVHDGPQCNVPVLSVSQLRAYHDRDSLRGAMSIRRQHDADSESVLPAQGADDDARCSEVLPAAAEAGQHCNRPGALQLQLRRPEKPLRSCCDRGVEPYELSRCALSLLVDSVMPSIVTHRSTAGLSWPAYTSAARSPRWMALYGTQHACTACMATRGLPCKACGGDLQLRTVGSACTCLHWQYVGPPCQAQPLLTPRTPTTSQSPFHRAPHGVAG